MQGPLSVIGVVSYSAGAGAFLLLALLLIGRRQWRLPRLIFVVASGITATWAGLTAVHYWTGTELALSINVLEQLRTFAWLAFLWVLLRKAPSAKKRSAGRGYLISAAGVVLALLLAYATVHPFILPFGLLLSHLLKIGLVVAGFVLIENLIRSSTEDQRWSIKFLCIGLGGMFVYDLFFYADALLFREPSESIALARGAVDALVVPLLVVSTIRSEMWSTNVSISQKTAVYSTALIASGIYLVAMSASAFYIRIVGGSWGPVIQAIFLSGGVIVLIVVLSSGTFRAYLKVQIAKHFFRYKYDYRVEWMQFTRTVSESQESAPLELRAIQAIAKTMESPGGAMWLRQSGRYAVASTWHMAAVSLSDEQVEPIVRFLEEKEWVLNISEAMEHPERYPGLQTPEWFQWLERAWILVPLMHRAALLGFVILVRPRAPRSLDWEDYDLLRMLGRQAASYLAEQRAAQELAEARQFERFNRRATFVMHDIKNLLSQLSLVSSNIEKHGDNPDFRKDMMELVVDAVGKMRRLMERMNSDQESYPTDTPVRVRPLLEDIVAVKQGSTINVKCEPECAALSVLADRDRLAGVLAHMVDNALDASGKDGWVQVALSRQDGWAIVEVIDNGPGMDLEFVRNELFKPFRSTKRRGFGIGAFQCREYARELGGDLEVVSSPGSGTTMRMRLPLAGRGSAVNGNVAVKVKDGINRQEASDR